MFAPKMKAQVRLGVGSCKTITGFIEQSLFVGLTALCWGGLGTQ